MRTRRLGLRLIGSTLAASWGLAAALVLLAYRPGGPFDLLVGVTLALPLGIAVAGVVWPPVTRGRGSHSLLVALGVATLLVLLPSIGGVLNQLQALGSQTLLPSPEAAYPWLLALIGTSLFTGFGQARRLIGGGARRAQRLRVGLSVAALMILVAGTAFAGSAVANELGLRDLARPTAVSRFGPTTVGEDVTPPPCDGTLTAGDSARLNVRFVGSIDGRQSGAVDLVGQRSGLDFRWLAYVATNRELGQYGQARLGAEAWTRTPTRGWTRTSLSAVAGSTLDLAAVRLALTPGNRATAEDHGIEIIEAARARRCRVAVDGPTFHDTFPQVRWLVGTGDLVDWRGQLDYWVFLDGEVGQVAGSVNGEAAGIEPGAIQGTIEILLTATERDRNLVIYAPGP